MCRIMFDIEYIYNVIGPLTTVICVRVVYDNYLNRISALR